MKRGFKFFDRDQSFRHGQALVEMILLFLILPGVLGLSGILIYKKCLRLRCAYFVFEATHAHLIGAPVFPSPIKVSIQEFEWGVRGEGRCHGMTERVELPWLEKANWD